MPLDEQLTAVSVVVQSYEGRELLRANLPSILRAAAEYTVAPLVLDHDCVWSCT
jgi:hypothetical protein